MTFDHHHYVPVLKIKRGEKRALSSIEASVQSHITPLLEVVKRIKEKTPSLDAHLKTAFKDLATSVSQYSRCFLDAAEMESDGSSAANEIFRRAAQENIVFTPVTGISRTADVVAALNNRTHGLAIRLTKSELENPSLTTNLMHFMTQHGLTPDATDLIMDLGAVDTMVAAGITALTETCLSNVPNHTSWRTFTISSCAFPKSMGGVERDGHDFVERAEWTSWKDGLRAKLPPLTRLPTFSDCGIQHPDGVEGFDPVTMKASAAIRYAALDSWLLIKGSSTKITPPTLQFPVLATKLVTGSLHQHFYGIEHCNGCSLMKASADGAPKLGSPEAWRRLGTIHHLTTVVNQLTSLP
jgi:hypothetical protein